MKLLLFPLILIILTPIFGLCQDTTDIHKNHPKSYFWYSQGQYNVQHGISERGLYFESEWNRKFEDDLYFKGQTYTECTGGNKPFGGWKDYKLIGHGCDCFVSKMGDPNYGKKMRKSIDSLNKIINDLESLIKAQEYIEKNKLKKSL